MARCTHTTLCDKVRQWLMAGRRFLPGTLVSSTNNTDHLQQVEDYDYQEFVLFIEYDFLKQIPVWS
jgi:hypothetical protein